jgi:hypothetical protein
VRVTRAQHTRPATRAKHAKKRHAAHKAKHARPAAKQPAATPQQRPQHRPTAVKGTRVAAHSASRNRDWLRWTLLLAVAAGLMGLSLSLALIGSSRRPARSSAARGFRLRRPRRDPIREVVAERVDRPAAELTAAAIAVPVPPLTLRAPAPEPKAQPEVTDTPVAPAPPPAPAAAPVASAEAAPVEPDVVPEPTEEICDIFVWRGYAKARFYARLDLDETDEFAVAESPVFRFRGNGMPDPTDAAKAAHRTLVEKLVAKGWEPEETSSGPWYAARFRRPLEPRH